ncbi:hypothetical protein ACSBR1_018661 [Camellia fascicularis]
MHTVCDHQTSPHLTSSQTSVARHYQRYCQRHRRKSPPPLPPPPNPYRHNICLFCVLSKNNFSNMSESMLLKLSWPAVKLNRTCKSSLIYAMLVFDMIETVLVKKLKFKPSTMLHFISRNIYVGLHYPWNFVDDCIAHWRAKEYHTSSQRLSFLLLIGEELIRNIKLIMFSPLLVHHVNP